MTYDDERFDEQLHDAYERIVLSDEASERILANLMAAQMQRETPAQENAEVGASVAQELQASRVGEPTAVLDQELGQATTSTEAPTVQRPLVQVEDAQVASAVDTSDDDEPTSQEAPKGQLFVLPRKRAKLLPWLSIAAGLVAALVIVRIAGFSSRANDAAEITSYATQDKGIADEEALEEDTYATSLGTDGVAASGAANEVVDESWAAEGDSSAAVAEGSSSEESMLAPEAAPFDSEEVAPNTAGLTMVDLYPRITLADGTVLTALEDGLYTQQVEAKNVGDLIGPASATPFDDTSAVACQVYKLVGDSEAFAVRYEGEDSYWRCTRL